MSDVLRRPPFRVPCAPLALALALAAWGTACSDSGPTPAADTGVGADAPADMGAPDVAPDTSLDVAPDVTPDTDPPRCTGNTDCAGNPAGAVCDAATGRCVQCLASADTCPAAQHCDAATSMCVPGCRSDEGCGGAAGDAGVGDAGDGGGGAGGRCDVARHVCVECVTSEHCPAGMLCTGNACAAGCDATHACPTGQACCISGGSGACVDTATNVAHCGACGTTCATPANGTAACAAGACAVASCAAGFGDCDTMVATGCETDTRTATAHCGACGNACPARANATATCAAGACGFACAAGFGDCDAMVATGCETDTRATAAHCGGCGTACAARPNTTATCAEGACRYACAEGFADCDTDPANGCEVDTRTSAAHCGMCGRACAFANAAATCAAGTCALGACAAGFADCDASAATGCETDTRTATAHCGRCGNACAAPRGTPACVASACAVAACDEGAGDCDTTAANGCETDTRAALAHCGACGNACPARANATATCAAGACGFACGEGFADCDAMAATGCEADTRTSAAHCGACGRACAPANATGACAAGACTVGACREGFADCNAAAADGCEASLAAVGAVPSVTARFALAGAGADQTPSEDISVAVGPRGEVYVLSYADKVIVFDADGRFLRNYPARGWTTAWDIAVDPATGEMWVCDPNNNQVRRLTRDGIPADGWLAGSGPRGIQFARGEVFVSDFGNHRVLVYDRAGTLLRTITSTGLSNPRGLAIGPSGNLYVASAGNNTLRVLSPTGALVRSWTTPAAPADVAVDECRGVVYVLCEGGDQWAAYRMDGTQIYSVPTSGAASHAGIALSADGARLYVSHSHGGGRATLLYRR